MAKDRLLYAGAASRPLRAPSPMLIPRSIARNVLPDGTFSVGVGLALSGASSYAFLALVARALGPVGYAPFAGLWSLLFLLSPALFAPFEQEVGRALAARRALGLTTWNFLRRTTALLAAVAVGGAVLVLAGSGQLLQRLFDDNGVLLIALLMGLFTYAGSSLIKGAMSGTGNFSGYGGILAAEGLVRVAAAAVLYISDVRTAGPYALAVALAPLVGLFFLPRHEDPISSIETDAKWSDLRNALWNLFLGSVFAALIVNGAPVALKALSSSQDRAAVSRFTASLLIARVPLFLFQAVQVALLPKLSALAAANRHEDFAIRLRRLVAFVLVTGGTATVAAATIGPSLIRAVFGLGFALESRDLVLLGLSSTVYMLALAYAQALIAYEQQHRAALAWGAGCAAFALTLLVPTEILLRVERSLLFGTIISAGAMVMGFYSARNVRRDAPTMVEARSQ